MMPAFLANGFGSMYRSRERAAGRQSDPYELEPDPDLYPPFHAQAPALSFSLPQKLAPSSNTEQTAGRAEWRARPATFPFLADGALLSLPSHHSTKSSIANAMRRTPHWGSRLLSIRRTAAALLGV